MADEGEPGHPVTAEVARFRDTLLAAIPGTRSGGIYADKPGFHNTVLNNLAKWPSNYSVAVPILRVDPRTKARAFDLIFPEAQNGDYRRITLYSKRLLAASKRRDPRLEGLYEWFGTDNGANIGFNVYKNRASSSDDTHDWHLHFSFMTAAVVVWSLLAAIIEVMLEQERDEAMGYLGRDPVTGEVWLHETDRRIWIAADVNDQNVANTLYLGSKGALPVWTGNSPGDTFAPGIWNGVNYALPVAGQGGKRVMARTADDATVWLGDGLIRRAIADESEAMDVLGNAMAGRTAPIDGMEKAHGHVSDWHKVVQVVTDLASLGVIVRNAGSGGTEPGEPCDLTAVLDAAASAHEASARIFRDAAGGEQ